VESILEKQILEKLLRFRQMLEKIQPGCTSPRSRKKSNKVVQLFRRKRCTAVLLLATYH
jgi:hypothetical protein